jgi:EAL domain-containing protein (putative c-di-GMP-specific phosphodiesterase class I)
MGGDEIAVLFIGDIDYEFIAEKILMFFTQLLHVGEIDLQISVNIGVINCTNGEIHYEEALRYADMALVKAKQDSKGISHYVIYSEVISEKIYEQLHISKELKKAINKNQITVVYQPKYDTISQKIIGFEALARWRHKEMGYISPLKFIQIAEKYALIEQLTDFIIEKSCEFAKAINAFGDEYVVSINISGVQMIKDDFHQRLIGLLYRTKTAAEMIGIEVTETAVMESLEIATLNLLNVKEFGVDISLDDFGTGYSSLNYLRKLPINELKIDKSFIDYICIDKHDADMISMIINLAKKLGIRTVAEGVENEAQYNMLKSLHCDIIQGYYFSRPLDYDAALESL